MGAVVVFRTPSEIEARVVTALLDSRGIHARRSTGAPPDILPMVVNPLGSWAIVVHEEEAEEARQRGIAAQRRPFREDAVANRSVLPFETFDTGRSPTATRRAVYMPGAAYVCALENCVHETPGEHTRAVLLSP